MAPRARVQSKRILVVEDDPIHRRAFSDRAREVGVHLDSIPSQAFGEALAILERYDVLMLNYDNDASFTGLEIAEFLSKKLPHKPLVMLTTTLQPWHRHCAYVPTIHSVVSKWEGVDECIERAMDAAQPATARRG